MSEMSSSMGMFRTDAMVDMDSVGGLTNAARSRFGPMRVYSRDRASCIIPSNAAPVPKEGGGRDDVDDDEATAVVVAVKGVSWTLDAGAKSPFEAS